MQLKGEYSVIAHLLKTEADEYGHLRITAYPRKFFPSLTVTGKVGLNRTKNQDSVQCTHTLAASQSGATDTIHGHVARPHS